MLEANILDFPKKVIYKKMLKKIDVDFNLNDAFSNLYILEEDNHYVYTSNINVVENKFLSLRNDSYVNHCFKIDTGFYAGGDSKILDIIFFIYNENTEYYNEYFKEREYLKNDKKYSKMLNAHFYYTDKIIENLKTYLDILYEKGFRLYKNNQIRENIKTFNLCLNNIVVIIYIDYDAMSTYIENETFDESDELE